MLRRFVVVTIALTSVSFAIASEGCSHSDATSTPLPPEAGTAPPTIADKDAAAAAADDEPVAYCMSTKCPAQRTTCPSSRFACDVDLMTDPNNCGACGFACPPLVTGGRFTCVAGKCELSCADNKLDCNGVVDDICETQLGTNDNCNGCGDKCPDPNKPCFFDRTAGKGKCGCDDGYTYCAKSQNKCTILSVDDNNCGACGNTCNVNGDGGVRPPNTYFGCFNNECGHLKCDGSHMNCNSDAGTLDEDGCETDRLSHDNCGACGNACAADQQCIKDPNGKYVCACPAGQTLCGATCVDFSLDPRNCGACGVDCTQAATDEHGIGTCINGACKFACSAGWGDCNGDTRDGCETNMNADPNNCGACGTTCDLLAGQPCVGGRCAQETCDGGIPR
ncbi:Tryptophan synthase alpha chain [Labilithrix luteola]|uniref:Tryptophan synthase alpha chain n=1 Tax=Labilithrix luteola TaxID=1391654 RepID=A0A0K1PX95_9BACT|nr:hypothetical protein [Labilithrix luteola]AKU97744.1 Tryptophan synthase alpha chain [Labilithrix luteola]